VPHQLVDLNTFKRYPLIMNVNQSLAVKAVAICLGFGSPLYGEVAFSPDCEALLQGSFQIGSLQLEPFHGSGVNATWKGRPLQLSRTKALILRILATHPNQIVSIETLADHYRDVDHEPGDDNINVHVMGIRREFESVDPDFAQIVTRRRLGFMWRIGEEEPDLQDSWNFGRLHFNEDAATVFWDGHAVQLSFAAQNIVMDLVRNHGRPRSFSALFWARTGESFKVDDTNVSDDNIKANIRVQISNIRKAFRAIDPGFDQIRYARGYLAYEWSMH
jgi:DNA-binding response OmpR family regulator